MHVLEAYVQCPKALIRSALWDPASHVERASLPSLGEILGEARDLAGPAFDGAAYDREAGGTLRPRRRALLIGEPVDRATDRPMAIIDVVAASGSFVATRSSRRGGERM